MYLYIYIYIYIYGEKEWYREPFQSKSEADMHLLPNTCVLS